MTEYKIERVGGEWALFKYVYPEMGKVFDMNNPVKVFMFSSTLLTECEAYIRLREKKQI